MSNPEERRIALLFALLVALRLVLALALPLYGDEAFYWTCSRHLAWSFVDHPFVTALLLRAGTALLGNSVLGVRLMFLLCAAALPFAVFALARPVVGRRDAWLAAGASMLLPLVAVGTVVAGPEPPLLLLAVATWLAFERASRADGRLAWWVLAGMFAALGLCTHYRFAPVLAGPLLWLLLTARGRRCWRTSGPWIAAALTLAGLVPVLLFNLDQDWQPLRYQMIARHTHPRGPLGWLLHLAGQAGVTTPVLWAALLVALVAALRAGRRGDDRRGLLACCALVPLGVYFLASPLTDAKRSSLHWPLVGYLPLLPLLPATLRDWAARGRRGLLAARAAPVLALLLIVLLAGEALVGATGRFPSLEFFGWPEVFRAADEQLASAAMSSVSVIDGRPLVVADNYVLGAQLDAHWGGRADVYVLHHVLNDSHGRGLQFDIWEHGDIGLAARRTGETALLAVEISRTASEWEERRLERMARHFDRITPLGEVAADLRRGDVRRVLFFLAEGVRPDPPVRPVPRKRGAGRAHRAEHPRGH